MDVVDAHLHLFKAISDEYPRDIFEGMTPPEREELAEEFLVAMDAAGIDRAVIVALSPHDEYLADVLKDHPGKFVGVAVQDFDVADPVADLERRRNGVPVVARPDTFTYRAGRFLQRNRGKALAAFMFLKK